MKQLLCTGLGNRNLKVNETQTLPWQSSGLEAWMWGGWQTCVKEEVVGKQFAIT